MLTAPFPYVGTKKRAAGLVWDALGSVSLYVEPFGGSLAVLLAAQKPAPAEVVNDGNPFIPNFWRALRSDPDGVLGWCADPVTETDYKARHRWLVTEGTDRLAVLGLESDPLVCDVQVAGWWVWGQSLSIGRWCVPGSVNNDGEANGMVNQRPTLDMSQGFVRDADGWRVVFWGLAERLRGVRVLCGSWDRAVKDGVLLRAARGNKVTGVFLDPPYRAELRNRGLYGARDEGANPLVSNDEVEEWCSAVGGDPRLRVVLAGLEGEYDLPGWRVVGWRAPNASPGNRDGERLWLSPYCLEPDGVLF